MPNLFQVDKHTYEINSSIQKETDGEIQEFRNEQQKASDEHSNQTLSQEELEFRGSYYIDPYLEDYNPMNTMIIIDLPWPQQ